MSKQEDTVREFIKAYKKKKKRSMFKELTYEDICTISFETAKTLDRNVSSKYVLNLIGLLSIVNDRTPDYKN